jgi:ABC-type multidrug transport system ATPase subunit
VRGHLGAVLFSGDDVKKKLSSLSGGEAARLIFARHVVEKPNVLVLDEPTNHLDLEAIDALVEGLRSYEGTLIFVSHDRWFVGELATRIIEITARGLTDFGGSYAEYLERCGDDHLDSEVVLQKARQAKRKAREAKEAREQGRGGENGELKRRKKQLHGRLEAVTEELHQAESRVHAINEQFCDPSFFERTPHPEISRLEGEQKRLSKKIDELLREWESLEGELAELA